MINLTEEQKALFLRDSVPKQFVVEFPNGEYPNITNEQILADSVSFTESLCSQDSFKLGLCEASTIEFKAKGIPDIKGSKIRCSIVADGVSILYGTFNVESASLNENGTRTVRGYSVGSAISGSLADANGFEYAKSIVPVSTKTDYIAEISKLYYALIAVNGYRDSDLTYSELAYSQTNFRQMKSLGAVMTARDGTKIGAIGLRSNSYAFQFNDTDVYQMDITPYNAEPLNAFVDKVRDAIELTYQRREITASIYRYALSVVDWFERSARSGYYSFANSSTNIVVDVPVSDTHPVAYANQSTTNTGIVTIKATYGFSYNPTTSTSVPTSWTNHRTQVPKIYKVTGFDSIGAISLPMIKETSGRATSTIYVVDYSNFDANTFIEAMTEIDGAFGRMNRATGDYELFKFTDGGVVADIPKSLVQNLTVSDSVVDSVTSVNVYFNNGQGESVATATSGDYVGGSYDVNNYITKNTSITDAQALAMAQSVLSGLNGVSYQPMTLVTKGMPYLELGDRIAVEGKDGIYETLILRRTINGVTHLTDTITAVDFTTSQSYASSGSSSGGGGGGTPYPGDAYINALIDSKVSGVGMFIDPTKVISVGSGTTYTAPYNGILYFQGTTGLSVSLDGVQVIGGGGSTQSGVLMLPMKNGQVMTSTKSLSQMFFCGTF